MIKAVIFDFGNVLCTFNVATFFANLARKSTRSVDELLALMPEISRLAIAYETGLITSDDFFTQVTTVAGIPISREDFIHAYTSIFTPIPSTFALIRALKPRYRLGLLSNTNEWHFEYSIKPVAVFPLFDAVTLSYEVKAMKPSETIYRDMLGKLGMEPQACAYIDDLQENVSAAAALGIHAMHYTSPAALLQDLADLGVHT